MTEHAELADASDEQPLPEELVDLTKVRGEVRKLVEASELEQAIERLASVARWPDSTRYLDDNVWLYSRMGELYHATGEDEQALACFGRGFELEPRELSLLKPYSELLFEHHRAEEGLRVVQSLLLHHKRDLSTKDLVALYRRMGGFYEEQENWEKARLAFEKALDQDPNDAASLAGLLRVVDAVGDAADVIKVRQKLIRSLDDNHARSMALIALGNDWIDEFNDPGRALDVYEQAVAEDGENTEALERIATVGAEIGDWRRVSRAYFTLAQITDDPKEQAEWIIRSASIARDHLWEPEKALIGFKKALDLDPSRLDAFKAVTSILVDGKDWEELEQAYVQLISANVEAGLDEPKLMTVLWQKLGELYKGHLKRDADAVFAYGQAASQSPGNYGLHASAAEIAEKSSEHAEDAAYHLRAMYELDSSNLETLDRLARVYLRQKQADRAFCVFRALQFKGHELDEKARQFVGRFDKAMFRPVDKAITPAVLRESIFTPELDTDISAVFAALKPALEEWTGESRTKYGLKRKDRVRLEEGLVFNNIYRSVGGSLGYRELPEIWHKPEQKGVINGALVPEGLIVGDELLGSGREEYAAFVIAKQLFLFLKPFYLAAIRPMSDLQVFFILGAARVRPEVQLDMTAEMDSAMKYLKKKIRGDEEAALRKAVGRVSSRETDLVRWLEAVEDSANRIGLLFSDDLQACRDYLGDEPQRLGSRSVDQKMSALFDWAISEEYFRLRERLGRAIG